MVSSPCQYLASSAQSVKPGCRSMQLVLLLAAEFCSLQFNARCVSRVTWFFCLDASALDPPFKLVVSLLSNEFLGGGHHFM